MSIPLNINLIIPFKDNKGDRLKSYRREIEGFRDALDLHVLKLKSDLTELFDSNFDLTLAARSDGNSKKYYWRFKSSKRDRKYNRLSAESIKEYLSVFDHDQKIVLIELEQELIYVNANLKLVKGMLDSIDQVVEESQSLLAERI